MSNSMLLLGCSFGLQSCFSIYMPTPAIPTGFKQKNDLAASGTYGISGPALSLAYSPLNHVYVMGRTVLYQPEIGSKQYHRSYDLGLGGYIPIDDLHSMELQGSFGQGSFRYGDPYSGVGSSLTLATGTYKNFNGSVHFIRSFELSQLSLVIRYGLTDVNYLSASLPSLPGNSFKNSQYGASVSYRTQVYKKLYFITNFGRFKSTGLQRTIRANTVEMFFGLEFRM